MWGKLLAGFRVSYVLTMFLMWPVVLAFCLAFPFYFPIWASILTFFLIVFVAAAFNSISAMLCSALCKKTSVALVGLLFAAHRDLLCAGRGLVPGQYGFDGRSGIKRV